MATTTITYGSYNFSPVPLISIERTTNQVGNRSNPLGYDFTMTLEGVLTGLPNGSTGLVANDTLMEELRDAFNSNCKLLEIKCGATVVMQIYPRVRSLKFDTSSNNWVNTVPYVIELEYDTDEHNEHPAAGTEVPPFIKSYSEEWNMEFVQENKYFAWDLSGLSNQDGSSEYASIDGNNPFEARVTHTVNVVGKQTCTGTGISGTVTHAAQNAINWVNDVYSGFGYDGDAWGHALSGWTNLADAGAFGAYDYIRAHSVNETDGTVNLTESWLILGNNSGVSGLAQRATETFSVDIRRGIDDGKVNVSVQGQLAGHETRTYTTPNQTTPIQSTSAYEHAEAAWSQIQDRVFPRAQYIFQQDYSTTLNPNPVNKVIGHQPSNGVITYAYEFNDRPCAFITGSLSENFTISNKYPTDVFAKLTVIGRVQGPVLQAVSTITEATRTVSIEAVMPQPSSCATISDLDEWNPQANVSALLCDYQTVLTAANDQVFKTQDDENWNPHTGRYSRTVTWTYQACSSPGGTSFC